MQKTVTDFQPPAKDSFVVFAKLIKWFILNKKSNLLREISLPMFESVLWLNLLSTSHIKINWRAIKPVQSLPTLTRAVTHQLHTDKPPLNRAEPAVSILA